MFGYKYNTKQEITLLKEIVQDLYNDLANLQDKVNSNVDNVGFSIYFDFTVPDNILSIEYQEQNKRCVICYLKKFGKDYHEWVCFCSLKQYNDLYAKYMEYLESKKKV